MPAQRFHRTVLLLALAALPGLAAAAGWQAGDYGSMPTPPANEGPRQAIPNAMTEDGTLYHYDGSVYYLDPYYGTRHYVPWSPYYLPPTTYYGPATTYYEPPATYYGPPTTYYASPPTYDAPTTTYYVPAPTYVAPYYGPTYYGPTYYRPPYYDRDYRDALALCDARPLTERPACRDDVMAGR
jgi:hypothetical protein